VTNGKSRGGGWTCPECGRAYDEDQQSSASIHRNNAHSLDTESYIQRYRRAKTDIPEKYHEVYEELTGSGTPVRVVQAAVCYIESGESQSETAEEWDVSIPPLRRVVNEAIRAGAVSLDYVRENSPSSGKNQFHGEDGQCGGMEVTSEL